MPDLDQININITDTIPPENFATIDKNSLVGTVYTKAQDNEWRSEVESMVQSGIKGVAKPNTPYDPITNPYPTPWVTGNSPLYEKYDVNLPGTYMNFRDVNDEDIVVTQTDLDLNEVQIWVKNGVSEKILKAMPQASVNIRKWEDLQPSDFPLNEGSQVIYENAQWMVDEGKTSLSTDLPSEDSLIWIAIGGTGSKVENLEKAARSFLSGATTEDVLYNSTNATAGSLKDDGTVTNQGTDAYNKVINIDLANAIHVQIKCYPIQSDFSEYAMFVGVRANGDKVELLPTQPNNSIFGTWEFDVTNFISGKVCYNYTFGESTTLVTVTKPAYGAKEDAIKLYVDDSTADIKKSLDYFLKQYEYTNPVFADINTRQPGALRNDNIVLYDPQTAITLYTILNVPTNGRKKLEYNAVRPRQTVGNNTLTYPTIVGKRADNSLQILLPASIITNNEPQINNEIDVQNFVSVSICYSVLSDSPTFRLYDEKYISVSLNNVKSYIDSITIMTRSSIDLYSKGLRESNTIEQNTTIFNNAFTEAKAMRKHLIAPEGIYPLANVQMKAGVNLLGQDNKTIFRNNTATPTFVLTQAESQTYIEVNQLPLAAEFCNQGVEIGHFIISGAGVATKGMVLNNMASSTFERIYMTGFTDVCLDMKGVLASNFNDCQFIKSANGMRGTISDNGLYWANHMNFTNCKLSYVSGLAVDWSYGAGVFFTGCDFSAIGSAGNLNTGVFKLRNMSQENTQYGITGIDLALKNTWSEQLYGGFYIDVEACNGRTLISDSNILKSYNVGDMAKGILNKGCKVSVLYSTIRGFGIDTSNSGITKVIDSTIESHAETTGGKYIVVDVEEVYLTQAQYDALSTAEKNNGNKYFIQTP
ncbi:MAG: hypothetical protein K0R36_537 [Chryseobacterium sp.]|jgi:hypothetical protein|nr:hypothetical protein [Chryseobacterium sp.]